MKMIFVGLIIFTVLLHALFPPANAWLICSLMWFGFAIIAIIRAAADNDEPVISIIEWEREDG